MATSPTESPPPPLFRRRSIQVSQQWPQPTFLQPGMADLGVYISNMAASNNRPTVPFLLHFLSKKMLLFVNPFFVKPVH